MKHLPVHGALLLAWWACSALAWSQDLELSEEPLASHREMSRQISAGLTEANQRAGRLASQLRKLKSQSRRTATIEDALSKVTRQKSRLEAELISVQRAADSNIAALEASHEKALAQARQELASAKDAERRLSREKEEITVRAAAELEQAQAEAATARQETEKCRQARQETAMALEQAREKWLRAEKALTSRLAKEESANQALSAENQRLRQETGETRREIAAAEERAEEQVAALSESRKELSKTQERLHSAEGALKSAELARTAWIEKQHQTASDLQAAENDVDTWKLQFAEAQKRLVEAQKDSLRTRELEEDLAAMQERSALDEQTITELQAQVEASRSRLDAAVADASESQRALDVIEEDLAQRKQQLAVLRSHLATKEKHWETRRVALRSTQNQLESELEAARATEAAVIEEFIRIDPVGYALNSARIDDEEVRVLGRVNKILNVYPEATFEITGHTCDLGNEDDNKALSERRAQRLFDFLAANGVSPSRMEARGMGESQPVADNDTDAGRQQNRRVEIQVVGIEN